MLSGCPNLMLCSFRENLRAQYNIQGNCMQDCALSCLCSCCVVAQAYQQLKKVPLARTATVHPEWSSGLLDCLADPPSILLVLACFCLAFGTVKRKMGQSRVGHCAVGLICLNPTVYGCQNRGVLRARYGVRAGPLDNFVGDFLVWLLLPCCALAQELRHLKKNPYILRGVGSSPNKT